MFGIGMPELLVILAVALIVIGPKKLPELARSLGKAMGEFKRATNDLKQSIEQETGLGDVRDTIRKAGREAQYPFADPSQRSVKSTEEPPKEAPEASPGTENSHEAPAAQAEPATDESATRDRIDTQTPKENGTS